MSFGVDQDSSWGPSIYVNGFDKFNPYAYDTVIYCGGFTLAEALGSLQKTFDFILNVTIAKLFLNEEKPPDVFQRGID